MTIGQHLAIQAGYYSIVIGKGAIGFMCCVCECYAVPHQRLYIKKDGNAWVDACCEDCIIPFLAIKALTS